MALWVRYWERHCIHIGELHLTHMLSLSLSLSLSLARFIYLSITHTYTHLLVYTLAHIFPFDILPKRRSLQKRTHRQTSATWNGVSINIWVSNAHGYTDTLVLHSQTSVYTVIKPDIHAHSCLLVIDKCFLSMSPLYTCTYTVFHSENTHTHTHTQIYIYIYIYTYIYIYI